MRTLLDRIVISLWLHSVIAASFIYNECDLLWCVYWVGWVAWIIQFNWIQYADLKLRYSIENWMRLWASLLFNYLMPIQLKCMLLNDCFNSNSHSNCLKCSIHKFAGANFCYYGWTTKKKKKEKKRNRYNEAESTDENQEMKNNQNDQFWRFECVFKEKKKGQIHVLWLLVINEKLSNYITIQISGSCAGILISNSFAQFNPFYLLSLSLYLPLCPSISFYVSLVNESRHKC